MSEIQIKPVNEADLKELKSRMKLIADADPSQYHNDFSLKRYLRAFKNVDDAFKVRLYLSKKKYYLTTFTGYLENQQMEKRIWGVKHL